MQWDWLFYAVPETNPCVPETVFCDRFWDEREGWYNAGVGIVTGTTKPYFGPIPNRPVGQLIGTPDMWLNGLSYQTWLNGGYPSPVPCWPTAIPLDLAKLRRKRSLLTFQRLSWVSWRGRTFRAWAGQGMLLRRLRMLRAYAALGFLHRLRRFKADAVGLCPLGRLRELSTSPGYQVGLGRLRKLSVWVSTPITLARLRTLEITPGGPPYSGVAWIWILEGDEPTGLDWQIWSYETGEPPEEMLASGSVTAFLLVGSDRLGTGYAIWQFTFDLEGWTPSPGTYWLQLTNGISEEGDYLFWDISNGPSEGWQSDIGFVGDYCGDGNSESLSFQILDASDTVVFDNTSPEYPGSYNASDTCLGALGVTGSEQSASTFTLP